MDISSLLNPDPEDSAPRPAETAAGWLTPVVSPTQPSVALSHPPTKPHKSPTITRGLQTLNSNMPSSKKSTRSVRARVQVNPVRPVHYPPIDVQNPAVHAYKHAGILAKLVEFDFRPSGQNGQYESETIPFPSEKRDLYAKFGREAFHVYNFTFSTVGDDGKKTDWTVTWDYEVGLVRMTRIFKYLVPGKTAPSQAIKATDGLREASLNITGGNLKAQGYWLPFDCARELCKTFCWSIKEVLTPLFGLDFADKCNPLRHGEAPNYQIDASFVRLALKEQRAWKSASSGDRSPLPGSAEEIRDVTGGPAPVVGGKQLRPRKTKIPIKEDSPFESGDEDYDEGEIGGEDEGGEEDEDDLQFYHFSTQRPREDSPPVSPKSKPAVLGTSVWTSINKPNPYAYAPASTSPSSSSTVPPPTSSSLAGPPSSSPSTRFASPPSRPSTASKGGRSSKKPVDHVQLTSLSSKKRVADPPVTVTDTETRARRARSPSRSESDDEDIVIQPASKRRKTSRRVHQQPTTEIDVDDEMMQAAILLLEFSREARVFDVDQTPARS